MKKLSYLLFPLTLLSFSQAIHAQNDASAIVISQSITNTPDANGQYTATIEAYVKGMKSEGNNYVALTGTKTIYEFLGFSSAQDLYNYANTNLINQSATISSGDSDAKGTYKFAPTTLYYYHLQDDKYYLIYIGINVKRGFKTESWLTNYYTLYFGNPPSPTRWTNHTNFSGPSAKDFESSLSLSNTYTRNEPWMAKYDNLGSSSSIAITLGGDFVIPSGATITKLTADCNGEDSGGTPKFSSQTNNASATVTTSSNGNTITITGFDFSTNACGSDGSANHGKKLIVTFPVATTVSNTGGSAMAVVNTVTVTNQRREPVTGFNSSTATIDLPNLTIQASGVNANDNCIFTVSGTAGSSWNKTFTVMTHGTTPVKLQALPAGTYTITPKSWPWTYNLPDPKNNVTLSGAEHTETFTFTPNSITTPHHGEATASTPAN